MLPLRIGLVLGASSLAGLAALHANQLVFALWLPVMGVGMAFSLAAIGALVIDHCRPEETGVASGMNTIMRTSGAAIGAQIAAAIVSAHPGTGDGLHDRLRDGGGAARGRARPDARAHAPPAGAHPPRRSWPRPSAYRARLCEVPLSGAHDDALATGVTSTLPSVTRVSVPAQESWTSQRVPRTVAAL